MAKAKDKVKEPLPTIGTGQAFLLTSNCDDYADQGEESLLEYEVDGATIYYFKIDLNSLLMASRNLKKTEWTYEFEERMEAFPGSLFRGVKASGKDTLQTVTDRIRHIVFDLEAGKDICLKADTARHFEGDGVVLLSTKPFDQAVKPFIYEVGKHFLGRGGSSRY